MDYTKLGRTGIDVSRICLGCMTFGVPYRGSHAWTLDEDRSRPIIRKAIEHGTNFFDTSNSYSDGTSEEITGRALRDFASRDSIVLATSSGVTAGRCGRTWVIAWKASATASSRASTGISAPFAPRW